MSIPNLSYQGGSATAQSGKQDFGGSVYFAATNYNKGIPTAFVIGAALLAGVFILKGK